MAVVLGHFQQAMWNTPHPVLWVSSYLFGRAHSAVIFFFLLSGFVLTLPFLGDRPPAYLPFLVKRICRIYLPYVIAILLSALLASRLYEQSHTGVPFIDETWSKPVSAHLLAQHMLMIGSFDVTQFNRSIWTLVIEMRVSFLFPVIVWIVARSKPLWLIASFVPCVFLFAAGVTRYGLIFQTFFYCMIFMTGSLLARHYGRIHSWLIELGAWRNLAIFVVGYGLCQCCDQLIPFRRLGGSAALTLFVEEGCIAACAVVVMLTATTSHYVRRVLHTRVLVWSGTRSYSIYLLHFVVLFTLIRTRHAQSLTYGLLPVYLCCTLVAAEIFFRLVEVPSMMLGRRFGKTAFGTGLPRLSLNRSHVVGG